MSDCFIRTKPLIGKESTETTRTHTHSAAGFRSRINWRVTGGFPRVLFECLLGSVPAVVKGLWVLLHLKRSENKLLTLTSRCKTIQAGGRNGSSGIGWFGLIYISRGAV